MPGRAGISPVIATVIIVAVTIAVAIAVAFWMSGLIGIFTGAIENVQITGIWQDTTNTNQIHITLENKGTGSVSITAIAVNGEVKTISDLGTSVTASGSGVVQQTNEISVDAGGKAKVTVDLCAWQSFDAGQSVEIKLITATGKEYPKLIVLKEGFTCGG